MTAGSGKSTGGQSESKLPTWVAILSSIAPIWAAIITGTVTIIVALLAFPPILRFFTPVPTQTPTVTVQVSPVIPTASEVSSYPTARATETKIIISESPTSEIISTPSLPTGMQVIFISNKSSGKAPLRVKFDARDSYFRDATGTIYPCGACNFTWSIRQGSQYILEPEKRAGALDFSFTKRGSYVVWMYVCRNNSTDCAGEVKTIDVQ